MSLELITLKLVVAELFLITWLYSRHGARHLKISDIFILMMMAVYLPYFFFNPQATSSWNELSFSETVMWRGEAGFMTVLGSASLLFLLKALWVRRAPARPALTLQTIDPNTIKRLSLMAMLLAALIFFVLMLSPEFRDFREKTIEFITGNVSGYLYSRYRSLMFTGTFLMDGVLGRLRFVVFPLLFLVSISWFAERQKYAAALAIALVFFIALPMSFAKLPFAYYFGYAVFYGLYLRYGQIRFAYFAGAVPAIMALAMAGLSIIYLAQYNEAQGYADILDKPFELAHERIWGESYSILLRYFAVYPDQLSFTGASGINLLAKFAGVAPRMPDLEVALTMLGPNSGSNPGVFFLGGYAAFGYAGLVVYSVLGFGILFLLDAIGDRLRTRYIRTIYLAIMSMNVLFFLQVALQTALLTYGVLVVPVILLAADWLLVRFAGRR